MKSVFKWANKNAEGLASLIPLIIAGAGAFKAYKKIKGWLDPASGATKIFDKLGDSSKKATKHTRSLKSALGSLAKMAGVAAVIASLALLAKSLEGIASQGGKAVAPLLGFAAAVSSIAVVLSKVGKKLNKNMKGIIAFSAGYQLFHIFRHPMVFLLASPGITAAHVGADQKQAAFRVKRRSGVNRVILRFSRQKRLVIIDREQSGGKNTVLIPRSRHSLRLAAGHTQYRCSQNLPSSPSLV